MMTSDPNITLRNTQTPIADETVSFILYTLLCTMTGSEIIRVS